MRKILILVKREFLTTIRTKSFIIGLIVAPILMGGSFFVIKIFEDKVDVKDKKIAVIDHSGIVLDRLLDIVEQRNKDEITDPESGEIIRPAYQIEVIVSDSIHPVQQKLNLSERVRRKDLHAFIEIGPEILHPGSDPDKFRLCYYAENAMMDDIRGWFSRTINNLVRRMRVEELNLNPEVSKDIFYWVDARGMGLLSKDSETGMVQDARQSSLAESLAVPYILMLVMMMMVLMFTVPLLSSTMEEKTERIAEVLLGSVTPFQFMMGKLLGSLSISLIGSAVYIIGGAVIATHLGYAEYVPYDLLPWFFIFLFLNIFMTGSIMIALGAACNNSKDAQSLQFPAMIPVLIPMFVLFPLLRDPLSSFSTIMSLIPPFTPMLMIVRQASPVTIPFWQPLAGLLGVLLFTFFNIWVSGRIFRSCILMQGKPPKLGNLIRWAFKG